MELSTRLQRAVSFKSWQIIIKSLEVSKEELLSLDLFPYQDKPTVEARNTMSKVLEDGYILFDESDGGIRYCYEYG